MIAGFPAILLPDDPSEEALIVGPGSDAEAPIRNQRDSVAPLPCVSKTERRTHLRAMLWRTFPIPRKRKPGGYRDVSANLGDTRVYWSALNSRVETRRLPPHCVSARASPPCRRRHGLGRRGDHLRPDWHGDFNAFRISRSVSSSFQRANIRAGDHRYERRALAAGQKVLDDTD